MVFRKTVRQEVLILALHVLVRRASYLECTLSGYSQVDLQDGL